MASSSWRILMKSAEKLSGMRSRESLLRSHSVVCSARLRRKGESSRRSYSDAQENIVRTTYPPVEIPEIPLHELVFENLGTWETKTAVECAATGKKLTYKELFRWSRSLAAALQKQFNLERGHRMAVVLPNCPEYPAILLAGSMGGVAPTTINPIYTADEISFQLKDTQPRVIFTVPELYKKCVEASNLAQAKIPIVVVRNLPNADVPSGAVSFDELVATTRPVDLTPPMVDLEDDLVLPYSSGTSGLPKGVQLSHRNIVSNVVQYNSGNYLKSNPDKETNQNIILAVLPMFHIYGMVIVTLDCLKSGGRLICLPRFEPKSFIEAVYTKKTEILYVAPPLVFFLGSQPMVESKHLKHVQHVVVGAAPCGKTDLDKLLRKAPNLDVYQGYGMTETSPVVTMTHSERVHKWDSIGHPLASTLVKVADIENGKPLPTGSRGEICVKGPQVMKGYFNRPEDTKNTFDRDGWLRTGDVGYYDEEGDFFIVDRMKELIKVKGFQVAPAELEEVLRHHPKIADAGVIGVDHPETGQVPKAFVVLKKGLSATEEEIKDYIKDRLSSYKQLKGGVGFVEEIPKSSAGKILRKNLRKMEEDS